MSCLHTAFPEPGCESPRGYDMSRAVSWVTQVLEEDEVIEDEAWGGGVQEGGMWERAWS